MSEVYELTAETRTTNGKACSRRLRRLENKVPAIIYGGEKNPLMIQLDHNTLTHALENEAFYSHILTLTVDGKKEKVVLKDLHRHPSRPKILHADFQRISAKTKIIMHVPLHFTGEENNPAVKTHGGVVSHQITEVEIRCLPNALPEFIAVDITKLDMGQSLHLSDIKVPKGVEILALLQGEGHDQPIVSIHKPIVIAEETTSEEESTPSIPPSETPEDESGA